MSQVGYFAMGLDHLGADLGTDRALVVKIKNLESVVEAQGGALGKLAANLAPTMISDQAYNTMKQQLLDGFKDKGVDADVQIVAASNVPSGAPPKSDFLNGALVGAGGTVALVAVWKLISRLF